MPLDEKWEIFRCYMDGDYTARTTEALEYKRGAVVSLIQNLTWPATITGLHHDLEDYLYRQCILVAAASELPGVPCRSVTAAIPPQVRKMSLINRAHRHHSEVFIMCRRRADSALTTQGTESRIKEAIRNLVGPGGAWWAYKQMESTQRIVNLIEDQLTDTYEGYGIVSSISHIPGVYTSTLNARTHNCIACRDYPGEPTLREWAEGCTCRRVKGFGFKALYASRDDQFEDSRAGNWDPPALLEFASMVSPMNRTLTETAFKLGFDQWDILETVGILKLRALQPPVPLGQNQFTFVR